MIVGYTYGYMIPSKKADEIREEKEELLRDFCIALTASERETLNSLTTERDMERFVRAVVNSRWN